jgi:hypothetical protein
MAANAVAARYTRWVRSHLSLPILLPFMKTISFSFAEP